MNSISIGKNSLFLCLLVYSFQIVGQAIHSSANRHTPMDYGQNGIMDYRIFYKEKTGELKGGYDPRLSFKSVNVFPVFSKFSDWPVKAKLSEGINYELTREDVHEASQHLFFPKYAVYLNGHLYYELLKKVSKSQKVNRPRIASADSAKLVKEINDLEILLKDSSVVNYKMSDSLYAVLQRYPADNEIFVDVLYFRSKHEFTKALNHWSLVRLFIFDLRSRQLIYYNYKMELKGLKYGDFTLDDVPVSSIRNNTTHYQMYSKKNKKYLKGNKKIDTQGQ